MNVSQSEREAIRAVMKAGEQWGYGNMIAHLRSAWARVLVEKYGMTEQAALDGALCSGYPLKMHEDIIERGFWDETGASYNTGASKT